MLYYTKTNKYPEIDLEVSIHISTASRTGDANSLPLFIIKVALEHSHAQLFACCLAALALQR